MERLQKILARGGLASRRAAEELITAGRVRVNGHVVTELGAKADPRKDRIEVDGKRVVAENFLYVVLHKPRGVVATMSDPEGRPTVAEILKPVGGRAYPVGRLDFATSGVLLATNDGAFADGMLHPKRAVPKTYVVKVKGKMKDEDLDRWRKGVQLEDGVTLAANVRMIRYEGDKTWFELTIREGRNQQIRRMGEATRFPVMRLARVAFAGITAEGLRPGQFRHLTREELVDLKKEYGVPKSATTAANQGPPVPARRAQQGASASRAGAARTGAKGRPDDRRDSGARGARDARGSGSSSAPRSGGAPQGSGSKGSPRGKGGAGPRGGAGGARGGAGGASGESPRYGGGSPGRRGYEVTEDWGGGARRGSQSGRFQDDRPRQDVGGGRHGKTRTTGTAGGVGARSDAGRVKGRRG